MLHANRRTDGRTDVTTVISASRDCAKAPEIISKRIKLQEVGGGRGDWMELALDRDGWGALVGTVRNFQVP